MLISNATRSSTKAKYKSIQNKWKKHCQTLGVEPMQQRTEVFLNFVASEYERNLRWGTLRSYVPALRPFLKKLDVYQVRQMLRGIFNKRPPVARYTAIWDVNIVLAYLSCYIIDSFKDITMKLATLYMLLSGNRVNMLLHMKMELLYINDEEVTFTFDEALKHDNPNINTSPMTLRAFPEHKSLCPVATTWEYLTHRQGLSSDPAFFVTHKSPHHGPQPDSIARWVKDMLVRKIHCS